MSSKIKQSLANKRRTQPIAGSAFDESVVFVAVTKIQKCLYDISKSKLDKIDQAIKVVNRDINVISEECKDKEKVIILAMHLSVFEQINDKKYEQALEAVSKKLLQMNERTNPILKLSTSLMKSLLLRFIKKQQESQNVLSEAISELNLNVFKIRSKSLDYRITEATIICISIVADYFNQFESHSQQFRSIYAQAYRISHKYLTQYHKLTQTLYSIGKKFPVQENDKQSSSKSNLKQRNTVGMDSNRSMMIKNSKSDRSSLDSSLRAKLIVTDPNGLEIKHNMKKVKPTKRLKTLDAYIDLQQSKEKCLSRLYGMEASQLKINQKKSIKRPKFSTSLKTASQEQQKANEMKELQSIYEIYLPKISGQKQKSQKLNAAEILKYGSSLEKLKPNYFDKLSSNRNRKELQPTKKCLNTPPIFQKSNQILENHQKQENKTKNVNENPSLKDSKIIKEEKQKPLPLINSQQIPPKKEQQSCQLI